MRDRTAAVAASLALGAVLAAGPARNLAAQTDPHAGHATEAPSPAPVTPPPRNEALPADADAVKAALTRSPRHGSSWR